MHVSESPAAAGLIVGSWRRVAHGAATALAALAFGMAAAPLRAQDIAGYSPNVYEGDHRDMALIPKYCIYSQYFRNVVTGGSDPTMIAAWTARMGPSFHHIHHYCAGLINANRALLLARDAMTRRFYLNQAVSEYDYVIHRSADDFILMPEIVTKKGEALVKLDKGPVAVLEFERAITLKPDYWPPYANLSDYYKDSGDPKKARETLESGLAKLPDEKALQRRLAELDTPSAERKGTKRPAAP